MIKSITRIAGSIQRVRLNRRKRKMKIRLVILAVVVVGAIIITTAITTALFNSISIMSSISGGVVSELMENWDTDTKSTNPNWYWDLERPGSSLIGAGGIYPKDPVLRARAEILEALHKSVSDANKVYGTGMEPAWILGSIYRESGNALYTGIDDLKTSSIFRDLVLRTPMCGKGGACLWVRGGHSHFIGGRIVGGVDKGDPFTQIPDSSSSMYNRVGGDHALGLLQFEIPWIYTTLIRNYGSTDVVITDYKNNELIQEQSKMDSELGFIRPNIGYVPDVLYNGTFELTSFLSEVKGRPVLESSDFRSLSERNQNFIKFMYASARYGRGHITETDDIMALALIKLVKSGELEYLDEMIIDQVNTYWNSRTHMPSGNWVRFAEDVNSRYNMGLEISYKNNKGEELPYIYWYGVYAANVGRVAYNSMVYAVEQAEKEQPDWTTGPGNSNGNWIGKPGSGVYGNSTNSKYYLPSVGIRWYHQTSSNNTYSSDWGNLLLNGTTSIKTGYGSGKDGVYRATMASGGCGIYTLAMIASNLMDKDVTPDIARAATPNNHVSYCLHNSGVSVLANKLGLQVKTINYTQTNAESLIKAELNKGNMILFISTGGPSPWYSGTGHFMALRGVTDDGKLLGISSVGNSAARMTAEQLMKVPITFDTWRKSLTKSINYVWVIGIRVD